MSVRAFEPHLAPVLLTPSFPPPLTSRASYLPRLSRISRLSRLPNRQSQSSSVDRGEEAGRSRIDDFSSHSCLVAEISSTRLRAKTVVIARIAYNIIGIVNGIIMPVSPRAFPAPTLPD